MPSGCNHSIHTAIVGILLMLGSGCSGSSTPKGGKAAPTETAKEKTATDPANRTESVPNKTPEETESGSVIEGPTGSIEGVVLFTGDEVPQSDIVSNTTDPLVCGAQISKRNVEISPTTKGIRYVLVWLDDIKLPDGYKPPRQNLVLDNRNCQFEPHAAAITVGSTVEATNSDEVFHTTNLYGPVSENMPLVSKGSSQKTVVRRPGTIQVKCDKHGWMQAFIRVDPHPFHAVTDDNGKFSIANVPAGTYKLKTWHEFESFHGQDSEVTVKPDETATLEIKYPVAK